jgi:hypothetical protein
MAAKPILQWLAIRENMELLAKIGVSRKLPRRPRVNERRV